MPNDMSRDTRDDVVKCMHLLLEMMWSNVCSHDVVKCMLPCKCLYRYMYAYIYILLFILVRRP